MVFLTSPRAWDPITRRAGVVLNPIGMPGHFLLAMREVHLSSQSLGAFQPAVQLNCNSIAPLVQPTQMGHTPPCIDGILMGY